MDGGSSFMEIVSMPESQARKKHIHFSDQRYVGSMVNECIAHAQSRIAFFEKTGSKTGVKYWKDRLASFQFYS